MSLTYVPDTVDDNDDAIIDLATPMSTCSSVAHQYVAAEAERAKAFGHGTVEHAVDVAGRAHARRLVLTHHGPLRTDDAVDRITAAAGVDAAREGMTIDL